MKRFRNILIVCEENADAPNVIARGLWLARENGARVSLLDAFDAGPGALARRYASLSASRALEIENQILAFYRTRLEALAAPFRKAGVEVEVMVAQGTPFLEIIRKVLDGAHDLVLKGASERGGSRIFASGDMHLMRKCPCPVWILKSNQPAASRRILAAIDPATDDETRMALNRMVMELAASLAAHDRSEVHVVHAWQLPEEPVLRSGRLSLPDHELVAILEGEEARHRRALDALMAAFPEIAGIGFPILLNGLPGEAIPAYARERGIDTIVMGTVGRSGISGVLIGNTAETILSSVECSVLAVKPPGFRSPVEPDRSSVR